MVSRLSRRRRLWAAIGVAAGASCGGPSQSSAPTPCHVCMDASIARDSAARPDALAAGDAHTDSSTHVVGDAMRDAPERTLDAAPDSGALGVVDASTMTGKVMYGYQGWFSAPADGSSTNVFWHWAKATGSPISASNVDVDLWPDTRELTAAELFATPLKMQDGGPANVFSAYTASTVALHFAWMKTYGIDGVMLQRFPADFTGAPFLAFRNSVTTNVMTAAEATGRVFSVMYDVTGMTESTMVGVIESDWKMLVDTLHITGSDRYLHHKGRPLVTLWGLGFSDRPGTPADATALIDWFHTGAGAGYEASVMGGVCSEWRTGTSDCSTAAGWAEVYAAFDVVSPWTVGRYTRTTGRPARRYRTSRPPRRPGWTTRPSSGPASPGRTRMAVR